MQHVAARLRAHLDADERVLGCARRGFAPRDQVWPGSTDGILDGVGQERGQHQGDQQPQDGDVVLVARGAREEVEGEDGDEGDETRVEDVPGDRDTLEFGVGEGDGQVVYEEESMEGLDEEDDLYTLGEKGQSLAAETHGGSRSNVPECRRQRGQRSLGSRAHRISARHHRQSALHTTN